MASGNHPALLNNRPGYLTHLICLSRKKPDLMLGARSPIRSRTDFAGMQKNIKF